MKKEISYIPSLNKLIGIYMVPNWEDLKSDNYNDTIDMSDLYIASSLCSENYDFLKYNSNWNWLMRAVVKCKENQIFGSQHLIDEIDNGLINVDIDNVYLSVVKFIEYVS